jgi:hypothetical protein
MEERQEIEKEQVPRSSWTMLLIAVFLFELSDFDYDIAGSPASLCAVEVN